MIRSGPTGSCPDISDNSRYPLGREGLVESALPALPSDRNRCRSQSSAEIGTFAAASAGFRRVAAKASENPDFVRGFLHTGYLMAELLHMCVSLAATGLRPAFSIANRLPGAGYLLRPTQDTARWRTTPLPAPALPPASKRLADRQGDRAWPLEAPAVDLLHGKGIDVHTIQASRVDRDHLLPCLWAYPDRERLNAARGAELVLDAM